MSRGVHMYYSDEIGHLTKRMSDNDKWYSDFYKQHKRKPNKAELWEMAREIYKGGGERYQMPEYTFEATDEMQEDFDALDQDFANLDILNDIKGKVENLTASEMAVVRGLTPSGYKVYQAARKQFERGNADVQKAGRMNAILFARYADRMADNISKITGKEYTAEDYMRERTSIVADATEVDESGYNHAAMLAENKRYILDSNGELNWGYINDVVADDGTEIKKAPVRMQIGYQVGKDKAGNGYTHIYVKHKEDLKAQSHEDIERIVKDVLSDFDFLIKDKNRDGGDRLCFYKKTDEKHYMELTMDFEFDEKSKETFYAINTLGPRRARNLKKVQKKALLFAGQPSPASITGDGSLHTRASSISAGTSRGLRLGKSSAYDTISISEVDEWVNKFTYNQTAYHGSPHTFDTFDLGAIGTGEGRQAHGWGLYFAQDKKVSEGYQSRLTKKDNVVVQYDGKENIEIAQALKHFASGSVYSALVRGTRDNAKIAEEIAKIVVTLRAGYRSDISFIEFLSKHIERIEENPKLSITNFLKEASKEDADRLKGIVDSAKYVAKMDGRRANINDVLDRLKVTLRPFADKREWEIRNADILESIDLNKLEIVGATGSLFEVDVPDNDVLLNEDKPLSEQPLKVRKAILEYYRQRPNDYIAPKSENDLGTTNGKQFYKEVVSQMYNKEGQKKSPERAASETLNALGIKGITYEGGRDGRCFVVFDDKAISVIERYNQSVRGQTRINGMSRVVSLFEAADKSTFVHELGHVALADLKLLAEMEGAPAQLVRD